MTDNVWLTKRNIRGVVSAEAGAANRNTMGIAFASREIVRSSSRCYFERSRR
jgi:hypothetical protein